MPEPQAGLCVYHSVCRHFLTYCKDVRPWLNLIAPAMAWTPSSCSRLAVRLRHRQGHTKRHTHIYTANILHKIPQSKKATESDKDIIIYIMCHFTTAFGNISAFRRITHMALKFENYTYFYWVKVIKGEIILKNGLMNAMNTKQWSSTTPKKNHSIHTWGDIFASPPIPQWK